MCDPCCPMGPADVVTVCGDTCWPRQPCPIPKNVCYTGPTCCAKGWDISQPYVHRFVDFGTTPLPRVSEKYCCWLSSFGPKTDSNLYASLYSSRVANAGYNMIPVLPPQWCGSGPQFCPCERKPWR